ncbi:MAG: hypothetical protein Tsb0024_11570 [Ruegeria sp.]
MDIECLEDLTEAQKTEWCEFLSTSQHQHPRQHPQFAEVDKAIGNRVIFATGRRAGRLVAVGIFVLQPSRVMPGRSAAAVSLSGPVCDTASDMVAFLQGLSEHPAFSRTDALRITPYWLDQDGDGLARALAQAGFRVSDPEPHRDTGLIDLTGTEDELRASFSRSARRKVRLVDKSEIEIRTAGTLAEAETFFERLNSLVVARHNLTPVSRAEYSAGFDRIFRDGALGVILCAYHQAVFLGGLLLYRSGTTAHARRYVADPGAAQAIGNLRVAPALWLEGMFWAKRAGCTRFDVEGFLPVEDKAHPNFNVYEYKREFKPTHARRIAEHTLALSPAHHFANTLPGRLKAHVKRSFPQLRNLHPARLFPRGGN